MSLDAAVFFDEHNKTLMNWLKQHQQPFIYASGMGSLPTADRVQDGRHLLAQPDTEDCRSALVPLDRGLPWYEEASAERWGAPQS